MDTAVVILIIILVIILGVYALSQIGIGGTTGRVTGGSAPQYSGGGGCGRG